MEVLRAWPFQPGVQEFQGTNPSRAWDMHASKGSLFIKSLKAGGCGPLCFPLIRPCWADDGQAENSRPSLLVHPVGRV